MRCKKLEDIKVSKIWIASSPCTQQCNKESKDTNSGRTNRRLILNVGGKIKNTRLDSFNNLIHVGIKHEVMRKMLLQIPNTR